MNLFLEEKRLDRNKFKLDDQNRNQYDNKQESYDEINNIDEDLLRKNENRFEKDELYNIQDNWNDDEDEQEIDFQSRGNRIQDDEYNNLDVSKDENDKDKSSFKQIGLGFIFYFY